jgi:hypothetical protein
MEARELYQRTYEAQIRAWTVQVDGFEARARGMTPQAKLDARPHLDALQRMLVVARAKLQEIARASTDGWDDARKGADEAWDEARTTVTSAARVFDAASDPPKPG